MARSVLTCIAVLMLSGMFGATGTLAQWEHCEGIKARVYRAAEAGNLDLVRIEENRYYACVNGVPTPRGPQNRRTPQPRYFESTLEDMAAKNHYCGTDGTQYHYCPRNKRCDPNRLGACIAAAPRRKAQQAFVAKRGRVCNLDSRGRNRCVNRRYN